MWQDRLAESNRSYSGEWEKMDKRELLYNGDKSLKPMVKGDKKDVKASHVRNIIFENIESQVSTSIPQPKVTPWRKKDERLAMILENWLRNELDRQPTETMNDMAERTVPIQGGVAFLAEWDNSRRTHTTIGRLCTTLVHPKQLAPQPGIYTGIRDMDWIIIKMPTTKDAVWRRYRVDVYHESESEPQVRSAREEDHSEDALTKYVGYEVNEAGGINCYTWVNDIELEDLEDCQARRQPVCKKCGRVRPLPGQVISNAVEPGNLLPDPSRGFTGGLIDEDAVQQSAAGHLMAANLADQEFSPAETAKTEEGLLPGINFVPGKEPEKKYDGGPCPWCGSDDWETEEMEYEQVILPIKTAGGTQIPGEYADLDDTGMPVMRPTLVPFYKPDVIPIVLQRSVSVFGQLWGNSDVDVIEDQQNTTNRIEKKIIDRLLKAGSRITLPNKAQYRTDPEDGERWFIDSPADRNLISLYEFKGNLQYELLYLSQVYEEARQILGITDSFQGRQDPTATSGTAKEYSAAMAAGRLESKRVMKQAAYADLFELWFKLQLAYADEPRPVTYKDQNGKTVYDEFNRYDFLEKDEDGQWYWNDQFLFSCDTSGPLASNREAMWQETRLNLQTGAFGDPSATETLVQFWTKMEMLHYPGAGQTKKYLEDKLKREQQQTQQMQMMQAQQAAQAAAQPNSGTGVAVGQQPSSVSQGSGIHGQSI